MAILSECRDDTDDMLWDIYKEKGLRQCYTEGLTLARDDF